MPQLIVCDADRKTVVPEHDAQHVGWGRRRVYSPAAYPHVEKYLAALADATREARGVFEARREAARAVFHAAYPEGLLPDEPGESEDAPLARVGRSAVEQPREVAHAAPKERAPSASVDDPR